MTQSLIYPTCAELFRMMHTEGRKFLAAGSIPIDSLTYDDKSDRYCLITRLGEFDGPPDSTYGVFEVIVPTIHSNGTSPEEHLDVYQAQMRHIQEAITMMETYPPHMRDFYLLKNAGDVYSEAVSQNHRRIRTLRGIQEELSIIIAVMEAKVTR